VVISVKDASGLLSGFVYLGGGKGEAVALALVGDLNAIFATVTGFDLLHPVAGIGAGVCNWSVHDFVCIICAVSLCNYAVPCAFVTPRL
jgi:hypothetical protein